MARIPSFVIGFLLLPFFTYAESNTLSFFLGSTRLKEVSTAELRKSIPPSKVTFFDPFHGKQKSYKAFPLQALLSFGLGDTWKESTYSDAIFIAADGYESTAPRDRLAEKGAYLAFEDLDVTSWEPIGTKKANPAPFYLFWTGKEQTTANGYPWPWQVTQIKLVTFDQQYPNVVPTGAEEDSPAYHGFLIFKEQCFRCHAMNRQGGKIGPDLDAPKNIVTYRSEEMVKEFIRKPSKYRYTQMPDHEHLTDKNLDDLYSYFRFKSKSSKN